MILPIIPERGSHLENDSLRYVAFYVYIVVVNRQCLLSYFLPTIKYIKNAFLLSDKLDWEFSDFHLLQIQVSIALDIFMTAPHARKLSEDMRRKSANCPFYFLSLINAKLISFP